MQPAWEGLLTIEQNLLKSIPVLPALWYLQRKTVIAEKVQLISKTIVSSFGLEGRLLACHTWEFNEAYGLCRYLFWIKASRELILSLQCDCVDWRASLCFLIAVRKGANTYYGLLICEGIYRFTAIEISVIDLAGRQKTCLFFFFQGMFPTIRMVDRNIQIFCLPLLIGCLKKKTKKSFRMRYFFKINGWTLRSKEKFSIA